MNDALQEHFDLFNQSGLIVESMRQWTVLVSCSVLAVMFIKSINSMKKTHRNFTYECVILSVELMKVFLFFIYEFLYVHMVLLLIVLMMQTSIRTFVCANFFTKGLEVAGKEKKYMRLFNCSYFSIICAILMTLLILSINPSTRAHCEEKIFSYQFYLLVLVDLIQSLLICYSAYFFLTNIKDYILKLNLNMASLSTEKKNLSCLQTQTKMLAIYYLILTLIDCMLMIVGNKMFLKDADFACYDGHTIIPQSNEGATYLMVYTILILLYSVMIWSIFYKIPEKYHLISKTKDPFDLNKHSIIDYEDVQQAMVRSLIQATQEEDFFDKNSSNRKMFSFNSGDDTRRSFASDSSNEEYEDALSHFSFDDSKNLKNKEKRESRKGVRHLFKNGTLRQSYTKPN